MVHALILHIEKHEVNSVCYIMVGLAVLDGQELAAESLT